MSSPERIQILTEETVNKVAAGEVVERPAAALKELLENSLDAGASQIDVVLEQAGRNLILVRDDGEGMSHDEALLALERHSTSKIRRVEDLETISTFGFRGEALPSLAAVSRMRITTRQRDSESGTVVQINAGKVTRVAPCGAPAGTEIELRSLFRNTPARLKFLKTRATELSHCLSAATRLALANPATGLHLVHGGRTLLRLPPAGGIPERLRDHLGPEFFDSLLPFSAEEPHLSVNGFVAPPGVGRPGPDNQQVFVNRRPVRDPFLTKVVREAGGEYFLRDKGPISYFIWIEVAPDQVDVNVHPTKREVRFRDLRQLRSLLRASLQSSLRDNRLQAFSFAAPPVRSTSTAESPPSFEPGGSSIGQLPLTTLSSPDAEKDLLLASSSSGQLFSTYLVCLRPDGLVLVDQHAAHERVVYERTLKCLQRERMQKILHPFHLDLDPAEAELLEELLPELEEFGIEIGRLSQHSFRVTGIPFEISQEEAAAFVRDIVGRVHRGETAPSVPEFRKDLAASVACHGSVRARQTLNVEEADALLRDLFLAEDPAHCPHGRPTFIRIDRDEIEKRFKRT
jgi:DNA mismatch repair protein MutL